MKKFYFTNLLRIVPDKVYLSALYFKHFHKLPRWKNPRTFNEKLQWLKINDRNPLYITLVDKYLVKKYVSSQIGKQFIIPTLGVWKSPEEIDFDSLPNQFVLKWNHDSGSVIICRDKSKLDKNVVIGKLLHGKNVNGFWYGREWPYKNVKPLLLAEKYMEDSESNSGENGLIDYKFMCFNGKVKCCFTCTQRIPKESLHVTFYDTNWELMPFERNHPKEQMPMPKPKTYEIMVHSAEQLSKNIPFVRVDFYEIEGMPYFGEMTFFPGSGFEPFQPEIWDYRLGNLIKLKK